MEATILLIQGLWLWMVFYVFEESNQPTLSTRQRYQPPQKLSQLIQRRPFSLISLWFLFWELQFCRTCSRFQKSDGGLLWHRLWTCTCVFNSKLLYIHKWDFVGFVHCPGDFFGYSAHSISIKKKRMVVKEGNFLIWSNGLFVKYFEVFFSVLTRPGLLFWW